MLKRLTATLFVAGILPATGVAQGQDIRLDTDPIGANFSEHPQIATFGSSVFVMWLDDRDGPAGAIYYNRSDDGGATWLTSDVRLDTLPNAGAKNRPPQMATSANEIYVAWQHSPNNDGPGDIYFNRSFDGGVTWLPQEIRIDTDAPAASHSWEPVLTVDSGRIFVVWSDARSGHAALQMNRSLDGGTSWLAEDVQLSNPEGIVRLPQIVSQANAVYCCWQDTRSGNLGDVFFNRSVDGGVSWLPADIRIGAAGNGNAFWNPQISAQGGSVYVVWDDIFDVYNTFSVEFGGAWSAQRRISGPSDSSFSMNPRLASDGSTVYVTWQDSRNSPFIFLLHDIYFNRSQDFGANWIGAVRIDTDPIAGGHSQNPQILANGSDLAVAWEEQRSGAPQAIQLTVSRDGGTTWLADDVQMNTPPPGETFAWGPRLGASSTAIYATWPDKRSQHDDIYFNNYDLSVDSPSVFTPIPGPISTSPTPIIHGEAVRRAPRPVALHVTNVHGSYRWVLPEDINLPEVLAGWPAADPSAEIVIEFENGLRRKW